MALVFLSAGEASGDHYGAEVMAGVRARVPGVEFFGLGGLAMAGAGLERVVRAEDVAVMGVTEIVRHVPRILREYRRLVRSIRTRRPAVAVLIDFPDVNFRLAKHLKRMGVPVVWFVSPQLWAWKRGRLRWVQERVDRMLVIFPFEERFYRARGVAAEFVGHPLAGVPVQGGATGMLAVAVKLGGREADPHGMTARDQTTARAEAGPSTSVGMTVSGGAARVAAANGVGGEADPYGMTAKEQATTKAVVALLPGSRWKEVAANLPEMVRAAGMLGPEYRYVLPVASTIDRGRLEGLLQSLAAASDFATQIWLTEDARGALSVARASLVASGTATVLAAVVGNPFVVVYRVSAMTFRVAKRLVRYPVEIPAEPDGDGVLPVAMVNLLAGRRVVPELINEAFTAGRVVAALRPLLKDGPARTAQIHALRAVRESLWPPGNGRARGTARVAEVMVGLMDGETQELKRG